jgi:hypothetical protein
MTWQPGQSGNPKGQPKRTKLWREALDRAIKRREHDDPLALEKLADKVLAAVDAGDVSAMRELGDRLDGKVPQALEHAGKDGGPIEFSDARDRLAHLLTRTAAVEDPAGDTVTTH